MEVNYGNISYSMKEIEKKNNNILKCDESIRILKCTLNFFDFIKPSARL